MMQRACVMTSCWRRPAAAAPMAALLPLTSRRFESTERALTPAAAGGTAVSTPVTASPSLSGPQPAIPLPGANAPAPAVAQPAGGAVVPATQLTGWCNTLSGCVSKAEELRQQMRAQEFGDASAQIMTKEGMDEFVDELKLTASTEINDLIMTMRADPTLIQKAPMSEVRRSLYYAVTLKNRDWIEEEGYQSMMKGLSLEVLRRDYDGALTADDVLFVSTHVVMGNYYNRQLWNRMEQSLTKFKTFENIDPVTVRGLSTKLFRTRRDAKKESLDVRRKILGAMARRVGVLANDFDLPILLGILQCYTSHELMPKFLEPLAVRAVNHINDFTPSECSSLVNILRKWGLMRLEVCEKLVERMCETEVLQANMVTTAFLSIRTCFQKVSEGGRNAINAEPTKQKLRGLGEQVACRLDEVDFFTLAPILVCLDVIIQTKIYVPKKCLQNVFLHADKLIATVAAGKDLLTKHGKVRRPITAEEGRQLQGFLHHYGTDLCPDLAARLKQVFKDGSLPDEASVF
jgi:hypothetical protein